MTRSSVVLPAPFGPNSARQSPVCMERSTPLTARRRPNVRATPDSSTATWAEGMPQDKRLRGALLASRLTNSSRHPYNAAMNEIDALLQENRKFAPPKEFRRNAVLSD